MAGEPRRHIVITDMQVRPGVPLDHLDWIGKAIVEYRPDVVIQIGDWNDLASLNSHSEKGSLPLEGTRYRDDIFVGNSAWDRTFAPMWAEIARLKRNKEKGWNPRLIYCKGNHEVRADRAFTNDPKFQGVLSSDDCLTPGFERFEFLKVVVEDGVNYSHYFKMQNSNNPVGGSIDNRLNKIGETHVGGHTPGFLYGNRVYPDGKTRHSLTCGSGYLHQEDYRGPQCNTHFRGIVVLNDVRNGDFDIMPLSLRHLCRKNTGMELVDYMNKQYPHGQDWSYLS